MPTEQTIEMDRQCRHCGRHIHVTAEERVVFRNEVLGKEARIRTFDCPSCNKSAISLLLSPGAYLNTFWMNHQDTKHDEEYYVFPVGGTKATPPPEVPSHLASDFNEAVRVLPHSPKASAALSRRCLQAALMEQGYNKKNLVDQITEFIDETNPSKAPPMSLRDAIDGIRGFGNFSAHPMTDRNTLQIIDVEPGEAEWCIEILLEFFEVYYVRPARIAARKRALDTKLASAGKPASK